MLENAVQKVIDGIVVDDITAYAKKVKRGRFKEEVDLDVYLKMDDVEEHLLYIKVYHGQKPYYRPWVEFYGINSSINLEKAVEYFDSTIEDTLLTLFSNALAHGGKVYVQYDDDIETSYGLTYSLPPAITRLGNKLLNLGFTWFKDWYFPEGGSEGRQKLQGEKSLDEGARQDHLQDIRDEVLDFIEKMEIEEVGTHQKYEEYLVRARDRAKRVLSRIEGYFQGKGFGDNSMDDGYEEST